MVQLKDFINEKKNIQDQILRLKDDLVILNPESRKDIIKFLENELKEIRKK